MNDRQTKQQPTNHNKGEYTESCKQEQPDDSNISTLSTVEVARPVNCQSGRRVSIVVHCSAHCVLCARCVVGSDGVDVGAGRW